MRPEPLNPLFASLANLNGIGDKTRAKLGVLLRFTQNDQKPVVADLLFHMPTAIINRKPASSIRALVPGEIGTVEVRVTKHLAPPPNNRRMPYKVMVTDETDEIEIIFYNPRSSWINQNLPLNETRILSGKIDQYRDQLQIVHPDYIVPVDEKDQIPVIEPVYPLTTGLSGKVLQKAIDQALERLPELDEWQDSLWLKQQDWPDFKSSLLRLHKPKKGEDIEILSPYRSRLAYDEILAQQLTLALLREHNKRKAGRALEAKNDLVDKVQSELPFQLTSSQLHALSEIFADMKNPAMMHRLLQGDVGSGKTVVALLAAMLAISAGTQVALMVPTEVLAKQHMESLLGYFEKAGLRIGLLTGKLKTKARREILADLEAGLIHMIVGTHALFQKDVIFQDLGLVIIDEQHRFGVHQRLALQEKGVADVLVMTATPIPRTLLMTAYGDMDVTKIEGKPAGRQPVKTSLINANRLEEILPGLKRVFEKGEQAYWICPLVDESEKVDLAAATERYEALAAYWPGKVGLIHGKLSSEEKDAVMSAFSAGELDLLIATTVIEVGVNVPNATVMVIEHAERFGLAQLHQLRGRVGRGSLASNCILLYQGPLSANGKARLETMRETEDGFKISEEDLRLRGGGELLGTRQSGNTDFRLAKFPEHSDLLEVARDDARLIITTDPKLESTRGENLRSLLYLFRLDEAVKFFKTG